MPLTTWWDFAFDRWRFDLWWPLVLAALSTFWLALGHWEHRRSGLPQFGPAGAVVLMAAQLGLSTAMVALTAPYWPRWVALAALAVLCLVALLLACASFAYTEIWRRFAQQLITAQLERALDSRRLAVILSQAATRERWGSPHGIAVLGGIYRERLRRAGVALERERLDDPALQQAVDAAAALRVWLGFHWASEAFEPERLANERLGCTLQLMLLLSANPALTLPEGSDIKDWQAQPAAQDHPHLEFLRRNYSPP
jgi:hypothetical protein